MASRAETEHPNKAFGWAARDNDVLIMIAITTMTAIAI